jgi:hypothetical protein
MTRVGVDVGWCDVIATTATEGDPTMYLTQGLHRATNETPRGAAPRVARGGVRVPAF